MSSKPETKRIFVYLSHIAKICAALAVLAFFLSMRVRAPQGEAGEDEHFQNGPYGENIPESAEPSISDSGGAETTEIAAAFSAASQTETDAPVKKLLNGRYKQVYYNGDVYIGDFVDSVRSGQGTYTWANGAAYTG